MRAKLLIFLLSSLVLASASMKAELSAVKAVPVATVVFGNETNALETIFTLVESGDYFGKQNVGIYYPEFIPQGGITQRDSFAFDPGALIHGLNVYPFMFTYKGNFYYLVLASTQLQKEKTDFPFFATIIKVATISGKENTAQIDTIANLYFKSNDTLAIGLLPDRLAFLNVTQNTGAGFVEQIKAKPAGPSLVPKKQPAPARKKKVILQGKTKPVAAKPVRGTPARAIGPLKQTTVPKAAPRPPVGSNIR